MSIVMLSNNDLFRFILFIKHQIYYVIRSLFTVNVLFIYEPSYK